MLQTRLLPLCLACALLVLMAAPAWAAGSSAVHLLFAGDVTLADAYPEMVPEASGADPGWSFRSLRPLIDRMDVFMLNLENSISNSSTPSDKRFVFQMDPALVGVLNAGGVDIVTLANNHVHDYGPAALANTIAALDAAGIAHVGAGMTLKDARRPVVMEIKGIRIAFLGYGNYSAAEWDKPGVAYRYPSHVSRDVRRARTDGADLVVVNFHWGEELAPLPTERDRKLAHLAVESGADVVVGHHPHVLQPVETYEGGLIAYSLGNFIFGGNSRRPATSALLHVTVTRKADGALAVAHEMIPIRIDPEGTRYQPHVIQGPEADAVLAATRYPSEEPAPLVTVAASAPADLSLMPQDDALALMPDETLACLTDAVGNAAPPAQSRQPECVGEAMSPTSTPETLDREYLTAPGEYVPAEGQPTLP